ncbi:FAD-dependent monooxygenase [Hyalangium rubrum]|uniref:FAD-dependent monooxygenase n=1 Tax=Hyalangium rubrum TaxID=3103134 RepID=A0ABU5HCD7_9BACT|nr:FAD-dependent monooxygenase [Hyalangium sp. s54d21]MDY7231125.1 FAD-dependent monooxygenase [Hyalangium sp. s54d21]
MKNEATLEADVAIVGAGAAGCLLATLLGRRGLRVLLLERGKSPPSNGADFLKPRGFKVLDRHGLAEPLLGRGALRRNRIRYYHDGLPIIDHDYSEHTDLGHYLIVPYSTTMSVLLEAMGRLDTVQLRVESPVAELRLSGEHVDELILGGGQRVRAGIVVGADGARSIVRESMHLPDQPRQYDQEVYMMTLPLATSVAELNRLYISSRRWMVYMYPVTQSLMRISISLPSKDRAIFEGPASGLIESIRTFVTQSDDALASITDLSGFIRLPTASMNASRYFRGNVVLLGDAAHLAHPVTGQGMSLTFEDAEALSSSLSQYFEGRASLEHALHRYEEARRPENERTIAYGNTLLQSFDDKGYYLSHFDPVLHSSMPGSAR